MDSIDHTIIDKLSKDSRTHCTEIASELGVATSTVHKRVNQMYNDGVIEQFTVILDPKKTGMPLTTFIGINVDENYKGEIVTKLKSLKNVLEVYEILQPYDIFLKVRTSDMSELKDSVLRVLDNTDGVISSSSIITTIRHKERTCILGSDQ
jgi:Lrp/AsnC family transcriptional regulator for asnA, asnC and gidA